MRSPPVFLWGIFTLLASGAALVAAVPALLVIVDAEPAARTAPRALARNVGLLLLFGLQHSLQPRRAVKAAWNRVLPPATERMTYVLASSLVFALLVVAWRPVAGTLWAIETPAAALAVRALGLVGWAFFLASNLAMSGGELIGLTQTLDALRGRPHEPPRFRTPGPYRLVRHPIMLGLIVGMWAAPVMTADRALFAAGLTLYAIVGILLEERDLEADFGDEYRRYRARVPMLLPRPGGPR